MVVLWNAAEIMRKVAGDLVVGKFGRHRTYKQRIVYIESFTVGIPLQTFNFQKSHIGKDMDLF